MSVFSFQKSLNHLFSNAVIPKHWAETLKWIAGVQAAMEITVKYCHKEMEAYGLCVTSNPSTWQQACHEMKVKVAQCTSSHPVIQKIRQGCSKEFAEFECCLRDNQDKAASCTAHVARFLGCAETVDLGEVAQSS